MTCLLCLDLRVRERHLSNPTTPILFNNTIPIPNNTSHNTISGHPGFTWEQPGPPTTKKVPHRNGFGTIEDLSGLAQNGEGGIRTHEGVTPTRFRVVRDQPDSATSPNALRSIQSLKADEPSTRSTHQKPTALQCVRLEAQPCSGDQLPGFLSPPMLQCPQGLGAWKQLPTLIPHSYHQCSRAILQARLPAAGQRQHTAEQNGEVKPRCCKGMGQASHPGCLSDVFQKLHLSAAQCLSGQKTAPPAAP